MTTPWLRLFPFGCAMLSLCGCSRAQLGGFVPRADLRLQLRRVALSREAELAGVGEERWAKVVLLTLSFQASVQASALPTRTELLSLDQLSPCADGDAICFEELAESESDYAITLEDLP